MASRANGAGNGSAGNGELLRLARRNEERTEKLLTVSGRTLAIAEKTLAATERIHADLQAYIRDAQDGREVLQNAVLTLVEAETRRELREERILRVLEQNTQLHVQNTQLLQQNTQLLQQNTRLLQQNTRLLVQSNRLLVQSNRLLAQSNQLLAGIRRDLRVRGNGRPGPNGK